MTRLLIDLLACQTSSRFRGIGRYTLELSRTLAKLRGNNDLFCMADPMRAQSFEELRQDFIRRLPTGRFLPYFYNPIPEDYPGFESEYQQLASSLICQARQAVSPDIVLTPSVFEGWGIPQIVVPIPDKKKKSYKQVGILYDLIPYIFRDRYLDTNPAISNWYLERFNSLKNFDLILAISEATRQDAIRLLQIAPEKVVNISSASVGHFRRINIHEDEKNELLQGLGIGRPFVLYLGGNEIRKNMEGAVRIFANLPNELIKTHQLVLNDVGDEAVFRKLIHSVNLDDEDVVIIKRFSDNDLLKLYNLCKVFIFPSRYEGFGLPILEAMTCGAPVLVANNSSLPEVVGRQDMLFEISDPQEASSILARVLTNPELRDELTNFGLERAKQFSWEKTARLAWQNMESLLTQTKQNAIFPTVQIKTNRPYIAFVSPLPPQKSGIADYSAELLPYLTKYINIDLFVDPSVESSNDVNLQNFHTYPWKELPNRRGDYDTVVYQFGNSTFHSHMFELVRNFPGVVVLHDFFLSGVLAHLHIQDGSFTQDLNNSHGLKGLVDFQRKGSDVRWDWPINWQVLRYAKEVIVHSNHLERLLHKYYHGGWKPNLNVIPHLRRLESEVTQKTKKEAKEKLNIPFDDFLICCFGHMDETKLNIETIEAFGMMQQDLQRDYRLVFVGDCLESNYHDRIKRLIEKLKLTDKIKITGFAEKEEYKNYLLAADMAIQLRQRSRGETSGAVLDCMSHGLPVILNAHGTLTDYFDEDVVKIKDPIELQELSRAIEHLMMDEKFGQEKGANARSRIKISHNPESIAKAYAEVIKRAIKADDRVILSPAFDAIKKIDFPKKNIELQAKYAALNNSTREQPRILIDVSQPIEKSPKNETQRVVSRIVKELFQMDTPSPLIEPVYFEDGRLKRACRFLENNLRLPAGCLGEEIGITVHVGDTLLILDASFPVYDEFKPVFKNIRLFGGKIITAVHDLYPINFPQLFQESVSKIYEKWLRSACVESDILLCFSATVTTEVKTYLLQNNIGENQQLDIRHFNLGADLHVDSSQSFIRKEVSELKQQTSPVFLTVGPIETSRGHAFILDAFETLWAKGDKSILVFAGQIEKSLPGNIVEVEARIRRHPMLNKKLFFVENSTNAELKVLFAQATALIIASTTDGLGLPIIEAAFNHVPAIASDIPIFHEIGGEGATYFSLESPVHLAQKITEIANLNNEQRLRLAQKITTITWNESALMLLELIQNEQV